MHIKHKGNFQTTYKKEKYTNVQDVKDTNTKKAFVTIAHATSNAVVNIG